MKLEVNKLLKNTQIPNFTKNLCSGSRVVPCRLT